MKKTPEQPEAVDNNALLSFSTLQRSAGILLHITSLPSSFGIGDLGPQARAFADFLENSGQTFWQLLPLNPTTSANSHSPYSANSSMAGNPLFISPEILVEEGLLTKKDIARYKEKESDEVDFKKAEETKCALLELAFTNYCTNPKPLQKELANFCNKEAYWLHDFALYSVLQQQNAKKPWYDWDEPFKQRDLEVLAQFEKEHETEVAKIKWQQFIFAKQWQSLKTYCNDKNIKLFGDMPIYVALDSSDVWQNRTIFRLDENGKPLFVSGTPPDDFNADGQFWGMPVFNWDELQQQGFGWWLNRLKKNLQFFDLLRLDHFRAFSAYWQVKAGAKTALKGEWIKAPGREFFTLVEKELGDMPFVAEDLGEISDDVYKLRDDFRLPGMEVLLFAFGDGMPTNVHILHNHIPVCVAYTGTHDTNTTLGWFNALAKKEKKNVEDYTGTSITRQNVCDVLCRAVYSSVSKLAMLPMQDVLELDESARMNMPSSSEKNWGWRMTSKQMTSKTAKKLKEWCRIYNRLPQ